MVPNGVRLAMIARYPPSAVGQTVSASRGGPGTARARNPSPGQAGRVDDVDRALEQTIGALLDQRRPGTTICPSEAARAVDAEGWRELMPAARAAAGRLAAAGEVEVTQRGTVVDVATAGGPVRIRRPG